MNRRALLGAVSAAAVLRGGRAARALPIGGGSLGVGRNPFSRAVRRHRLTKGWAAGLGSFGPWNSGSNKLQTFMYAIPIEGPCYAARLMFGNSFSTSFGIASASIWPSDSYSVCAAMQATHRTANTTGLGPTGGAPESIVYFDNAGADKPAVNVAGSSRSLSLPGIPANTGSVPTAYTYAYSDFVPVTSIPRADGGTQHLLFVYVTLQDSTVTHAGDFCNFRNFNLDPVASRNRPIYRGFAFNRGADFSDNPTGTGWNDWGDNPGPLLGIQYLAVNPGIQVVVAGDSLSAAPTNDTFSTPLTRAAYDLSTPQAPIEVATQAWGGSTSLVYLPLLLNNAAALMPSLLAVQPLSRNDGATTTILQQLIAKNLALLDGLNESLGTLAIFNNAGCEPFFDGNSAAIAAFNDCRSRLLAAAASSTVPIIDAPGIIGVPSSPWDYQPTFSDDNTHINTTGSEALTPAARSAIIRYM